MNITKTFESQAKSCVKLTVTIPKEEGEAEYKAILTKYSKTLQIPGFRTGHAPTKLLEQKYGKSLEAEVAATLIDKSANEIFEAEKENAPLGYEQPKLEEEPKFSRGADFTYSITYDIRPKVEIKDTAGITIKVPVVKVDDKDLADELKKIQERNATVEAKADDEPLVMGDIADTTFVELDESDNEVDKSKRENFVITTGSGENIYRFDDDLVGMKKGDEKIITKTYDKEEDFMGIKGKTLKLKIKINEVRKLNLPEVDDDLAQDVSEEYKTVDDLKKALMHNIETARDEQIKNIKNTSIIEEIVKKNDFDLPQSMINMEVAYRLQEIASRFRVDVKDVGRVFAVMGQDPNKAINDITESVTRALKARLVIDKLEEMRNITVTEDEIETKYGEIAQNGKNSIEEVRDHYKKSFEDKQYLIVGMKDDKLYDALYKEVTFSDGESESFSKLMGQDESAS